MICRIGVGAKRAMGRSFSGRRLQRKPRGFDVRGGLFRAVPTAQPRQHTCAHCGKAAMSIIALHRGTSTWAD